MKKHYNMNNDRNFKHVSPGCDFMKNYVNNKPSSRKSAHNMITITELSKAPEKELIMNEEMEAGTIGEMELEIGRDIEEETRR
eukprot:9428198-Pyramimonas_sp.AAC.2